MIYLGIVIPYYNGGVYIDRLVDSLQADSESYDASVYIIDNSLKEHRLDQKKFTRPNVFIIQADEGIGYGKACNIGYKKCLEHQKDIMVIANQDGYFSPGSLKLLVNTLAAEKDYCVSMPLLTLYNTREVEAFFTLVYLTPMTDLVFDLFAETLKPYYRIKTLCGACFAMKINLYNNKVPFLFDEIFYMYYEDEDLQRRLNRLNLKMMFIPKAIFHHQHSNTDPERQQINTLIDKQISKNIYTLKRNDSSAARNIMGWILLEFRNLIQFLLQLDFKSFIIEITSFFRVLIKLLAVIRAKQKEASFYKRNQ